MGSTTGGAVRAETDWVKTAKECEPQRHALQARLGGRRDDGQGQGDEQEHDRGAAHRVSPPLHSAARMPAF